MVPERVIFTEPPPPTKVVWGRTLLAMSSVLAATVLVTMLWRAENWPGSAVARALVLGFGIAFGGRFGAHGRVGGQMIVQIVIGAISSALLFAIYTAARV